MQKIIEQLLMAFTGSLGFALLFGLRFRHLLWASLGGLLSWGVYLGVFALKGNVFFACLISSAFSMIYSECMARLRKCPATLFVITAIIPLVPGSSLYYTMSCAVNGEIEAAKINAHQTLVWVLAISAGISFVAAVHELFLRKN